MFFRPRTQPGPRSRRRRSLLPRLEALEIRLAPATQLAVTVQPPASVAVGSGFGLVIAAENADSTIDTTFIGIMNVALESNPYGATLGGTSSVEFNNGVAAFTGLSLNAAGTGYTLQAACSGLGVVATNAFDVTPAAQLVVISPPPAAVTAGSAFGLGFAAEDQYGNIEPAFTGSVTLALAHNPGGSTLGGTANVTFSNGLATFAGLTLNKSGTDYTLVASSSGLAPPPLIPINVTPGAATQLVVSFPPPAAVTAGSAFGLVIVAGDQFGNVDPTFTGSVTLALASNPGGSTLAGTTLVSFSNGLATFTGLTLNKTGTDYTLQASSSGLAPPSSSLTLNVTPAAAAQLVVTTPPPATVTAGQVFPLPLTVAVEDAFGNTVTGFVGNLAVAPTSVAVEGSLGGTLTVQVNRGTATFAGLYLDRAGVAYTLQVTATGLPTVTTSPFSVLAGPAAELVVTAQPPASVAAGSAFGLVVQVGDQYGNVIPLYAGAGSVTVALAGPPPGVALGGGTTSLSFSAGLATFTGLTLDTAGGYTLQVSFQPGPSDNPLASATSNALSVTAAAATKLVVTSPPPAVVTAGNAFGLVIAAEDPFGNVVPTLAGTVTLALAGNPGGGALGGPANTSFSAGLATFAGLTLDTAASGYTLQFSSSGLAPPAPIAVAVTAAAATQLVVTAPPPATVTAGQAFGVTVAVEDAFGNPVTGFIGNLAIAPTSVAVEGSLGGTLTVQVSGGTATFAGLSLDKAGAAYTLQVTGTGLPAVTTSPFSVTAAAPAQLVVTTPPPASVAAGSPFGLQVSAEDQYGNVDSALAGSVTVALVNNPGGSTLGGTTTVSFTSGVATFASLTLSRPGVGYTLQATSSGLASPAPIALNVTAPVAAQLVVTSQPPAFVAAGGTFGLTVVVEDANGNPVTGFIGNLSVSPTNSAVEGSLGGALTVPVIDAVATFAGLSLDKAGNGLTLQVSVGGLLAVTTNPFSVTVGPTAQLAVTVQPPTSVAAGSGFGLQASAEDQYGNVVSTYGGSVTVALADNPTGGALGGTTTATFSNGTATFAGLTLTRAGTGYTLQVSGGGLISPTSSPLTVTAAAATQLFVVSRPPAAVVAGSSFGLQISAQDPFGNVNSSVNGSVTVALAADPGGGALGGTTIVSFSNGLATFALTLDTAAIGYTLQAASSGLVPPAPIPVNVTAAAVSQLVVISQPPATIFAGQGFGLTVAVEDAFGNTVTGFNGNLAIATANAVTGGLGGVLTAPATAGLATFAGLTIATPGSALTLQVSGTGLSAVTTSPFSVTAAPAAQLVVTSQPSAYVTAGSGFGLQISAEDSSGNVDPTFNGNVTVALASNLGGSSLGGTVTVAATGGVATFAGLILSTASAGYVLQATSGGLAPATTGLIDALTPGTTAPTAGASGTVGYLAVHSQPTVVDAGGYFQLIVVVENAQGATDTSFSGTVTLALAGNPGGATLGGNLTMPVSHGVLTFYGLTLNVPGSGYTIRATGNGLALAVSSPITVVNPPVRLVAIAPPPASVPANGTFGLAVAVVDASGNLAPGYNGPVTIALTGKHGKAKLRGTLTVAAVNGVATFSGLTLTNARKGQALQVQVTAGGLTSVTTNRLNVLAAAARNRAHRTRNKVPIHRA